NPKFNLSIQSNRFTLLNTTQEDDNDLFYGKMIVSSDMKVTGTMENPVVSAELTMEKGSDLTFIVPNTEPVALDQEGIVEFVDKDNDLAELFNKEKNIDTIKAYILGVDFTGFIKV